MSRALYALALVTLVVACERPGDPAKTRAFAAHALRGALTYPNSSLVNVSAGEDAAEISLSSPDSITRVVDWFRRALPLNGWRLLRDVRDQNGTVSMYAEHDGRPLWITLQPNVGGAGTTYTVLGAVAEGDTTKGPTSR